MRHIAAIRAFIGKHKPELLEIFSSVFTVLLLVLAVIRGLDNLAPSLSVIADVMSIENWVAFIGLTAFAQLGSMIMNDDADLRHPFRKPSSWGRFLCSAVVGGFWLILVIALTQQTGINHVGAPYLAFVFMNIYIMTHVLVRRK